MPKTLKLGHHMITRSRITRGHAFESLPNAGRPSEQRAGRVYGLRPQQSERLVVKAACLDHTRVAELRRLQSRDRMDFASATQQVLLVTDDIPAQPGHSPSKRWTTLSTD
ncbi:hypothetical protein LTR80_012226 [Exophiala xenobiotica]